ncbi:MAG: MFS transporter [Bacteroidaceae bacterium]|nr:MFS transporter [Bacteroidaceae bacterium]
MAEKLQQMLSESKAARWTALIIVSFTMMFAYFFTDVMSPLEPMLTAAKGADGVGLGWSADDYGFFSGSYGFFNVFLLMLFFGGIILDKFGIRFTGIMATGLMFGGALIKWYAVGNDFEGEMFGYPMQVIIACLGFAIYGVGCEIAGITVSKVIVKWFTGHELALAMGLQVALARIGTAGALALALPFAQQFGGVSASVGLGASLLCAGLISYLVYCVMDKKFDKEKASATSAEPEEGFRFADLKLIFANKGFWLITLLCLMFYAGVFPFLKFATKLMVTKYGIDPEVAGLIPAMLPFGTIFLTPFFGSIYDRYGKGATLMVIGSIILTVVHCIFAIPGITAVAVAIAAMILLGIAFGLVPSAMWPSVPKIIPMQLLGTAYAVIFYIQNIGLSMVPILIGKVNQANTTNDVTDYTTSMAIFAACGIISIVIAVMLKMEDKKKGYGLEQANIKK